jgi:MFS family permease
LNSGFPFSFGVLQDYYSTHEPFSSHPKGISAIGTTCSGIMYCAAPLAFAVYTRFPRFLRWSTLAGLPTVALAMFLSSFATKVWHLTLTQGVIYAIGGGLVYYPIFTYIDEWFVRRKGLAFGVMWAGSGCGGLSGPLVLNWGLNRYGPKVFLRGWAVALVHDHHLTL